MLVKDTDVIEVDIDKRLGGGYDIRVGLLPSHALVDVYFTKTELEGMIQMIEEAEEKEKDE